MTPQPERRLVERFFCPGIKCRRSWSRASSATGHIANCWRVVENRACFTCTHFDRGSWQCNAGEPLEFGIAASACPVWEGTK